jgi:hypothetical protein
MRDLRKCCDDMFVLFVRARPVACVVAPRRRVATGVGLILGSAIFSNMATTHAPWLCFVRRREQPAGCVPSQLIKLCTLNCV